MNRARCRAAAGTLFLSVLAAAAAGCGFGPGEAAEGTATLTITRDYGAEPLGEATVSDPVESDSVVRFLDREAEITTRYGDNFVQSIDGLAGRQADGSRFDWFFYVNGYWSPIGAAEAAVHPGDRIWWDYREWTAAYRVPAVVGSFPEPFVHGYAGEQFDVHLDCEIDPADACERVEAELGSYGVAVEPAPDRRTDPDALRILVGPYSDLRGDSAADLLIEGPGVSGVFASASAPEDELALVGLGIDGEAGPTPEQASGLIAATRVGEQQPTWLVTGIDRVGVEAAAELFDAEHLRNRFALAVIGGEPVPLPIGAGI